MNIIRTLSNESYEKSLINVENIKIKTNFFKIKTNGNTSSTMRREALANSNILKTKFIGEYYDKMNSKLKPHILMTVDKNDEEEQYSLTRSEKVRTYENGQIKDIIKTIECGKTHLGKKQYALHIKEGEDFKERYEKKENFSKDTIKAFNFEDFYTYLGKRVEVGAYLHNSNPKEGIVRCNTSTKIEIDKKEVKNPISNTILDEFKNMTHKQIGEQTYDELNIKEKFEIQKEFKEKVEKTKKEADYYDND